jgi:hypothetical protein
MQKNSNCETENIDLIHRLESRRGSTAWGAVLPILALALLTSCASFKGDHVARTTERGPYLDSTVYLSGNAWRFLTPRSEECIEVLEPNAKISRSRVGIFGRLVSHGGVTCNPVGIGTLERWRRGRREGEMAPSSAASWRIIHEDDETFLLRGRFPLASRLGFANARDVVTMIPNDDICAPIARSGSSNLLFRTSGSRVLTLGRCLVIGVARPISPR